METARYLYPLKKTKVRKIRKEMCWKYSDIAGTTVLVTEIKYGDEKTRMMKIDDGNIIRVT